MSTGSSCLPSTWLSCFPVKFEGGGREEGLLTEPQVGKPSPGGWVLMGPSFGALLPCERHCTGLPMLSRKNLTNWRPRHTEASSFND